MSEITIDSEVLKEFDIQEVPTLLPGGEGKTFKAGNLVLKHVDKDGLENTNWICELSNNITQQGFRISKPVNTKENTWVTTDGWTAWNYLEGTHDFEDHIPESIDAIIAFHKSLKNVSKPDFLETEDNPYRRADKYAFGDKPDYIDPQIKDLVDSLYDLRKPVAELEEQLIHGDLNPDNILISSDKNPAIIDITPYWRPSEFALAVYAYWIGPWKNNLDRLKHFSNIKEFNQMLIRAAIRTLLIMSESKNFQDLEQYAKATEVVKDFTLSR